MEYSNANAEGAKAEALSLVLWGVIACDVWEQGSNTLSLCWEGDDGAAIIVPTVNHLPDFNNAELPAALAALRALRDAPSIPDDAADFPNLKP